MIVARSRDRLRERLAPARRDGRTVGLVPTMGFLHRGHLALIEAARAECDLVVVSIFVNPSQFGPGEDFDAYPRDEARDLELCEAAGADLVYIPTVEQVYPEGFATTVEVSGLTEVLCGAPDSRGPEHFRGVTTVVCKLFGAVGPDRAYFGRKDAQQLAVIRRMATDLELPVEIRAVPTVREPDGLALSSRNVYLEPDERVRATALSRALNRAEAALAAGRPLPAALDLAASELTEVGIEPEYLEARDAEHLTPADSVDGRPVLIAVAARVGKARLIDNVLVEATTSKEVDDSE